MCWRNARKAVDEAPSSRFEVSNKFPIPSSNQQGNIWDSELGTSLERGTRSFELRFAVAFCGWRVVGGAEADDGANGFL